MTYVSLIIGFLILLCLVITGLQNHVPLTVKFLFWDFEMSLSTILLWAAVAGALIIAILSLPKLAAKHFETKRLRKEVVRLEKLHAEDRGRAQF